MDIQRLLKISARDHDHLCPRQILGVRLGLAGMNALGFAKPPTKKRLLLVTEMDGCFVDGLSAATGCTVGHRTLRVKDYGKTAAVFVDTVTRQALRVAPVLDIRQKASVYATNETRHYFSQMQAYQVMPVEQMFTIQAVTLIESIDAILGRPGVRVECAACGEEIINEREIKQGTLTLCHPCAQGGYYRIAEPDTTQYFICQHENAAR